jgi:cytosine/adenosine deaminase-related metal-dependent hydrolase
VPLLIRGGHLLRGPGSVLFRANVLVDGERIVAVEPPVPHRAGVEELDATGLLVIPGLSNAHTHGHNLLLRGLAGRWTLEDLLNHGPALNSNRTPDDHYVSAALSAIEMLRSGCTTAYELFTTVPAPTVEDLEAVARAYTDVGMRAVVAGAVGDLLFWDTVPGLSRAVGLEGDLSALEPGRQADIVLLRADSTTLRPMSDVLGSLIYVETGASVDTVVVGGRVVLRAGRVLGVDEARLRERAQAAAERLRAQNAAGFALAAEIAPYLSTACRAAAAAPYPVNRYVSRPA